MDKKAIPKIIKKIENFVQDESGIISKKNILKTGAVLGAIIAFANVAQGAHDVKHDNNIEMLEHVQADDQAVAEHSHNINTRFGH